MYTIGTAAIRHIADTARNAGNTAIADALDQKYVAFVGSPEERQLQGANAISINQHVCFFEITATDPLLNATVYGTEYTNGKWEWVLAGTIQNSELLGMLKSASGWNQVLYAVPRGNKADMTADKVRKIDGLPFFARDTRELYMYDKDQQSYVLLTNLDNALPVGGTMGFPEAAQLPVGWLRCDGTDVSRTDYYSLYSVIHDTFGSGDGTSTFTLPKASSTIIRY